MNEILNLFEKIKIDPRWSLSSLGRKDTTYATHGYHRYPAKFIPQIISPLISKYSNIGDLVIDPMGGCGTTLVEAKIMGRPSVGVDINPVAVLITQAKITPIEPSRLEKSFNELNRGLKEYSDLSKGKVPPHERIDYWFQPNEKCKLAFIFSKISDLETQDIRDFYYCAFSNILKNCSIWLQKSNKPTRDMNKKPSDPFQMFNKQVKMMIKNNTHFYELLKKKGYLKVDSKIYCTDARTLPLDDNSVTLAVTSPPYVTSYEYADLHQLTALWFEYTKDLSNFRKRFIGTAYHNKKELQLKSQIAESIVSDLTLEDKKTAKEVENYFGEMLQVFEEMARVLKKNGRAAIVIGNTKIKGVNILNAEVNVEQFKNIGFIIDDIIKREIPSKNLPSIRDKSSGRFAKVSSDNKISIYPTEYILIMKKIKP